MNRLSSIQTIYLHRDPVDFRKSINGLAVIVEQEMKLSPFDDALFVFCSKDKNKLKVLYWDKTGFALWYKRLEKNKFKWPRQHSESVQSVSEEQWQWLLSGLDIQNLNKHPPLEYQSVAL